MRISLALLLLLTVPAFAQRRTQRDNAPAEGSRAPDFDLARMVDHETRDDDRVRLSSFEGDKPVVLIFGSYT